MFTRNKMRKFRRNVLQAFLVVLVYPVDAFNHYQALNKAQQMAPVQQSQYPFYLPSDQQQQHSQYYSTPQLSNGHSLRQQKRAAPPLYQDHPRSQFANVLPAYQQGLVEYPQATYDSYHTTYFPTNQYQPSATQQRVRIAPPGPVYLNVNARPFVGVPGRVVPHVRVNAPPFRLNGPQSFRIPLTLRLRRPQYELENDPSSSSPPDEEDLNANEIEAPDQGSESPPPDQGGSPPSSSENHKPPHQGSGHHHKPPSSHGEHHHKPSHPPENSKPEEGRQTKLIHKHISIHVPPEDMEEDDNEVTVVKPKMPGPDKHVNIIFIKAPAVKPRKAKTEVVLPEMPEQKTLIYVLVKRPDPANDASIRVRGPPPTTPPKPQVFFVRYKQKDEKFAFAERKRSSHN